MSHFYFQAEISSALIVRILCSQSWFHRQILLFIWFLIHQIQFKIELTTVDFLMRNAMERDTKNMLQTWLDFVLTLGFYRNFSIASLKKISGKIFAMLLKMQRIFICITEQRWAIYLLSTGWNSCPYVRTSHGIFTQIFQWQTRFHWAMALTKPGSNPIGFFPVGAFKK